jgi:hypothetical protein
MAAGKSRFLRKALAERIVLIHTRNFLKSNPGKRSSQAVCVSLRLTMYRPCSIFADQRFGEKLFQLVQQVLQLQHRRARPALSYLMRGSVPYFPAARSATMTWVP